MTRRQLGVLGTGDPVADAWVEAAAASPDYTITARWPGPGAASPEAILADAAVELVLIADAARRADLRLLAARAGKPVLGAAPVAPTWAAWRDLTRQAPGEAALLSATNLRALAPLIEARRLATSGEAGPLFSAYIAYRARAGAADLDSLLFASLDYLHWCAGAPTQVWAARRTGPDAVIAQFTFEGNRKAMIEVALTLPATFPQPVEFEVELMCRDATLRSTPFDQAIALYSDQAGTAQRPWFPDPAFAALGGLQRAAAGDTAGLRTWADDGPVLELLDAVHRSLATGAVVPVRQSALTG